MIKQNKFTTWAIYILYYLLFFAVFILILREDPRDEITSSESFQIELSEKLAMNKEYAKRGEYLYYDKQKNGLTWSDEKAQLFSQIYSDTRDEVWEGYKEEYKKKRNDVYLKYSFFVIFLFMVTFALLREKELNWTSIVVTAIPLWFFSNFTENYWVMLIIVFWFIYKPKNP